MDRGKSRKHKKSKKPGSFNEPNVTPPEKTRITPVLGLPTEGLGPATMPSPILDMPIEILNLIMKDFELRHLLDACLVSRALNTAATPALYRSIELRPNNGPPSQIPRLLRSLMSRPELCMHVKGIIIGTDNHRNMTYPISYSPYFPIPLGSIDILQAVDLIRQTGMNHQDCWIEHFKKGDTEAALTLLLTLLPNLTCLTIESDYNESAPFLSLAIQEACSPRKAPGKSPAMFQNLELVSFNKSNFSHTESRPRWADSTALSVYSAYGPARTDWSNFAALSLFYLPRLREISISIDSTEEHDQHEFWPCGAPDLGGLEVLQVDRIRENRLGAVLATCSRLRKLTWTIRQDINVERLHSSRPIDRNQLVAALAPISTTLTDLTLIAVQYQQYLDSLLGRLRPTVGPTVGPTGSPRALRDFASIKTLTVPWILLMGHDESSPWSLADVLPRNLEHLIIQGDSMFHPPKSAGFRMNEFKVYSAIRDWLRNWRDVTPRLKSFTIILWQVKGTWTSRIRRELKELCRRVGVEHTQDDGFEGAGGWEIPAGWEW